MTEKEQNSFKLLNALDRHNANCRFVVNTSQISADYKGIVY
jgi:hypothetical protein